jgi:hypothetical protein
LITVLKFTSEVLVYQGYFGLMLASIRKESFIKGQEFRKGRKIWKLWEFRWIWNSVRINKSESFGLGDFKGLGCLGIPGCNGCL